MLIVTPSRENYIYEILVAQGLKCVFTLAQLRDSTLIWSANRFYTLLVTEVVIGQTEVGTNLGNFNL